MKHLELDELGLWTGDEAGCSGQQQQQVHDGGFTLKKKGRIARQSAQWLDLRLFATTGQCIQALRTEGYIIWATELSQVLLLTLLMTALI